MDMKPILFNTEMVRAILNGQKTQTRRVIRRIIAFFQNGKPTNNPPFDPGDVLWVRETWNTTDDCGLYPPWPSTGKHYMYLADDPDCEAAHEARWRPSIHMPKEAARIFLRVTGVRAERLQDMDEGDVCDEGAERIISACEHMDYGVMPPEPCFNVNQCKDCIINHSYPELFGKMVWDKTIKPADLPRFGWAANPWVWVIEFERIRRDEVDRH